MLYIKYGKETITSGNVEIEKYKFHHYKNPILLNDADIDNIFISKDISSTKKNLKCFFRYLDGYKIKPFSIIPQKKSAYLKGYDVRAK